MRIEKINLERFGRRSNLQLEGLSDQLNVVYGPNGSGKSTTIQFVRWLLYGNCDQRSRQYVNYSGGTALGNATIVQDGLRRKLARQDDGSRQGRLFVDGKPHIDQRGSTITALMGSISHHDFDLTFAPSFDDEPNLSALLQSACSRGMELTSRREPSDRVQEIRLRIDNYRRDLDRLPWTSQELAQLVDHRNSLQRRVGQIEEDHRRRRVSLDSEYEEITHQIQDLEAQITRLRGDWHTKDNDVNTRRRELEEAWRIADEARQEFLRVRRNELVELENQLERARGMQAEFHRRYERLDRDLRDHELSTGELTSEKEKTICLVQSIANQLDDLRAHGATPQIAPVYRAKHDYPGTVRASAASLDALRGEVSRLCRVMQADRIEDKHDAASNELKQLQQCEVEIQQWAARLLEQRDRLAKEIDEAERFGVSLIADHYGHGLLHGEVADPEFWGESPLDPRRVRAVLHSCDGYEPIEPDADALLQRLTTERESISRELDTLERRLKQLLERKRELELGLRRVSHHELEGVRREIAELDQKIRAAEDRERIAREIERLEGELARLRDDIVPSHITSHAVEILRELSRGRFVDVRFVDGTSVMVQESSGAVVPHSQLSRGVRDQVYLSFCMALIAAYRRQGVEMPLVLNDAFVNIDSDQDDALAAVLSGFARQQHQVILFTRHRHVIDLFQPYAPRVLELGLAHVEAPVETTPIDQVRFKPYRAADVGHAVSRPMVEHTVVPSNAARPASVIPMDVRPVSRSEHITQRGAVSFRRGSRPESNSSDYHSLVTPTLTTPQSMETTHSGYERVVPDSHSSASLGILPGDTPLELVETMDHDTLYRLATLGIHNVDDFLRSSPDVVERELSAGSKTDRPLRRWRQELTLRSMVPDMAADDASALVACGYTDIRALAETTSDTISRRWQDCRLQHRDGRIRDHGWNLRQLDRWISVARSLLSRRRDDYRERSYEVTNGTTPVTGWNHGPEFDYTREYSRDFSRSRVYERPPKFETGRPYENRRTQRETESAPIPVTAKRSKKRSTPVITGNTTSSVRSELAPEWTTTSPDVGTDRESVVTQSRSRTSTRRSRSQRSTSRSNRSSRRSSGTGNSTRSSRATRSSRSRSTERTNELRFYLDRSDAVVDAPSIGAKTANKLRLAGVVTVDDLLTANPTQLANKLDDRRIDAETIATWQSQTTLCCRVPQLRGHDAQILVACGVETPEQLAKSKVDKLWSVVAPFAKSTEGKRIIRGGKAPDRAEVADWIDWSQSSRPLRSA